jgi:alpha-beta hydrolase superfamily lysophospholipase
MLGTTLALSALDLGRRYYRQTQIFEPARDPVRSWNPEDYGIPAGVTEEHWIDTPDGERLHAWYCRAPQPKASGVFCHGNKGNLTISADLIPRLLDAGLSILFFDYRGYGKSSGRTTYSGVLADALTAARYHETLRPTDLPSILYGFSLGGAVAAQTVRRHPFDALILHSTFTSLTKITRVLYPRIPMHLLAGKLFDTESVVRAIDLPLLVLHGTADEVIPCAMARQLFGACPSPAKRIYLIEDALHKDTHLRDPEGVTRAIAAFLAEVRMRRPEGGGQ